MIYGGLCRLKKNGSGRAVTVQTPKNLRRKSRILYVKTYSILIKTLSDVILETKISMEGEIFATVLHDKSNRKRRYQTMGKGSEISFVISGMRTRETKEVKNGYTNHQSDECIESNHK
jgi:hypothetical protein